MNEHIDEWENELMNESNLGLEQNITFFSQNLVYPSEVLDINCEHFMEL